MRVGGIIAEYNPFHNGHKYQIDWYKKNLGCTHIVAAMSGNFVQRGGPSIFDKYTRAEMAVLSGVDLVLEIPSHFACQTAEFFAKGAVLTLDSLKSVDSFCFGSEEGSVYNLRKAAEILVGLKGDYEGSLSTHLKNGYSFPVAREMSLRDYMEDVSDDFFTSSNNILGIEYLKALINTKSNLKPVTIKRKGEGYNSITLGNEFSSATAIRKEILSIVNKENDDSLKLKENIFNKLENIKKYIPESSYNIIVKSIIEVGKCSSEQDFFEEICLTVLREEDRLTDYFEINESLKNPIRKNIVTSLDFEDLISSLSSKTYTASKVRRALFNVLLGISKSDMNLLKKVEEVPYVRVLAFNKKGTEILKEVKANSDVDVIMSPAKSKLSEKYIENKIYKKMLDFDLRSSSMYFQKFYSRNRKKLSLGEPDYISMKKLIEIEKCK
ncbi:nucleotidyltransferase [Peptostreptococcus faecalis]|uniref:nucleotidyltransferase n=1 Tax=Peptostreptococcus faecalis TaxID=2045015 RepID=UPI000C7BA4CA|nr:nucleotidyltransferase [Peptostreptococcus faecalis]